MADPVRDVIGDYRAFVAQQRDRLRIRGIDIAGYEFGPSPSGYRSGTNICTCGHCWSATPQRTWKVSGTGGRCRCSC